MRPNSSTSPQDIPSAAARLDAARERVQGEDRGSYSLVEIDVWNYVGDVFARLGEAAGVVQALEQKIADQALVSDDEDDMLRLVRGLLISRSIQASERAANAMHAARGMRLYSRVAAMEALLSLSAIMSFAREVLRGEEGEGVVHFEGRQAGFDSALEPVFRGERVRQPPFDPADLERLKNVLLFPRRSLSNIPSSTGA